MMAAESNVSTNPDPTRLSPLPRVLGLVSSLAGAGLLVFIFYFIGEGRVLTQVFGLPQATAGGTREALFLLHVPILVCMLMIPGGIGLAMQRSWSWSLLQISCLVVACLSIQLIVMAVSGSRYAQLVDAHLIWVLVLQALMMALLLTLFGKEVRTRFKIKLWDTMVALLFTGIILLDWLVTLYSVISAH